MYDVIVDVTICITEEQRKLLGNKLLAACKAAINNEPECENMSFTFCYQELVFGQPKILVDVVGDCDEYTIKKIMMTIKYLMQKRHSDFNVVAITIKSLDEEDQTVSCYEIQYIPPPGVE